MLPHMGYCDMACWRVSHCTISRRFKARVYLLGNLSEIATSAILRTGAIAYANLNSYQSFPMGRHCAQLGLLICSTRLISGMKVEEHEEKLKPAIAKMFSVMHKSVSEYSQKMLDELKRHNYVTPTNYLVSV